MQPTHLYRLTFSALGCWMAILLLGLGANPAAADDAQWSVGIASVRITPPKPVPLAGYAARTKPFEKVDQDIYARALALRDNGGKTAVVLTLDLCTMPREVAEGMISGIMNKTRLDRPAILINLAHSHSA